MKIKHAAALVAAITLALGSTSSPAQVTNLTLYNFDTDQVSTTPYGTTWGNWFGGVYQGVAWDSTTDAGNNPNSGAMQLFLNFTGSDQYVLNDGVNPAPNWGPFNVQTVWTNLSFMMRYDPTSAIRTNGNGSLDFGLMRIGSRGPSFNQAWFYQFAVPATNGAGLPNTNWIQINADLRQVPVNFSDLAPGLIDIIIGMDAANFGNNVLIGSQTLWFDNIKFTGFLAPIPPPTLKIEKTTPALRMFGGNGIYGRSQVSLTDPNSGWIGGGYPVSYSFTLLGNANAPGNLDTHIQFIPLDWDTSAYNGNPDADYFAANELWLRITSGTGASTACVADIAWKTNSPFSNPTNVALVVNNPVRAGTWTLTFTGPTAGTLTAPGASPAPFTLAMSPEDATNNFSGLTGPQGPLGVGIRIGNANNGNQSWGGVPDDWASISISGTAGSNFVANFTSGTSTEIDTNRFNLANSSGGPTKTVAVPINAPYWVKWSTPDPGFVLINGSSLTGTSNWTTPAGVIPNLQAGVKWALIPSSVLPIGSAGYFALINRSFSRLQVLLPGETNAPNTPTGKIGTPNLVSLGAGGSIDVTINAVDSTYHIVTTAPGDTIAIESTDVLSFPSTPAALVNGTVTQQLFFGSTGTFTVTATNMSNISIPNATSSSVTVAP